MKELKRQRDFAVFSSMMILRSLFGFGIVISSLTSCSLFSDGLELQLSIEPGPGRVYELLLPDEERPRYVSRGERPRVRLEKRENLPVIACVPGTDICAAGFFPMDLDGGVLELSWEQGFLGGLLMRLYRNRVGIGSIDLAEAQRRILRASDGNPWLCDPESILFDLGFRGKISGHIALKEGFSVHRFQGLRNLPSFPGRWRPINPFAGEIDFSRAEGEIPLGHSWYFSEGSDELLMFEVGREGWECRFRGVRRCDSW